MSHLQRVNTSPSARSLVKLLAKLSHSVVVVLGDIILDEYIQGSVSRISPEAPVPVLKELSRKYVLGGAANVAANVSELSGKAILIGRLGQDFAAQQVLTLCKEKNINIECSLASKKIPTICKTRVVAGYQQLLRIDKETVFETTTEDQWNVLESLKQIFSMHSKNVCVVISDYGKGFFQPLFLKRILDLCEQNNVPTVVDPKSSDLSIYKGATLLKPNLKEATDALKRENIFEKPPETKQDVENMLPEFGAQMLKVTSAKYAVLSLSELGVALFDSKQSNPVRFQSTALQVADVSGAGDTMVSVLAMGLAVLENESALKNSREEAHKKPKSELNTELNSVVYLANLASGIVCGKLGTATCTQAEILDTLMESPSTGTGKIVDLHEANRICTDMKKFGKKIVFTNGCFDIFHAGHAQLLQQCKQLGDYLVVGVNSDTSVKILKGNSRPVNSLEDRMAVLSALGCTDLVLPFEEETPIKLIESLLPNVLAKGGDYEATTVVGYSEVVNSGGRVEILPLLEGRSTTNTILKTKHFSSAIQE